MMKRHLAKKASANPAGEVRTTHQVDHQMAAHEAFHAAALQLAVQQAAAIHTAMHLNALQAAAVYSAVHSTASHPHSKGKKNRSGKRPTGFSADQEASLKSQGFVKTSNGYSRTMFWSSAQQTVPVEPTFFPSTSDDKDNQSQWDTAAKPQRELLRALHGNDASAKGAAERSIIDID